MFPGQTLFIWPHNSNTHKLFKHFYSMECIIPILLLISHSQNNIFIWNPSLTVSAIFYILLMIGWKTHVTMDMSSNFLNILCSYETLAGDITSSSHLVFNLLNTLLSDSTLHKDFIFFFLGTDLHLYTAMKQCALGSQKTVQDWRTDLERTTLVN